MNAPHDLDALRAGRPSNTGRRLFLQSSAVAGGLMLGFHVPTLAAEPTAAGATPELNAWVVVQPDETVIIRIARSQWSGLRTND